MEESLTSGTNQTLIKEQTTSLLEIEEVGEGFVEEDGIIHQMTQQIIQGRLNDSITSVTQIVVSADQSMPFAEVVASSSPQFYEIDEDEEPDRIPSALLEAVEQSHVLIDSPTNMDTSDIQLVAIFNKEAQASPEQVTIADKEHKIKSPGTADFGDGLDSQRAMKTKPFTNAPHLEIDKLDEIDRILKGETSIYMNQDAEVGDNSLLMDRSHNSGFNGDDREWKDLHDLSIQLEDSLLNPNQSSAELIKQV